MKPAVVVLAAPSGSGKTTIARALVERWPERYGFSVSGTTRPPRPGEREGIDYYFLPRAEFLRRVTAGEFLESAEYAGELYGTLKREVDRLLGAGRHVLLDIEVQGAAQVRRLYPGAASRMIFILPPSGAELLRRLEGRRTEAAAALVKRLETAIAELGQAPAFDQVIVNDELDTAVQMVDRIVQGQTARQSGTDARIKQLVAELKTKLRELS